MKVIKFLSLALTGALVLTPSLAQAQFSTEPLYVTLKFLYGWQKDKGFNINGHTTGFEQKTGTYDDGNYSSYDFSDGIAIGYGFGSSGQLPVWIKLGYLYPGNQKYSFDCKSNINNSATFISSHYSLKSKIYSVFGNVDLNFKNKTDLIPYICVNLRGGNINSGLRSLYNGIIIYRLDSNATGTLNNLESASQSSLRFGWIIAADFSYQINSDIAFDLRYKFSDFGKVNFSSIGHILNFNRC